MQQYQLKGVMKNIKLTFQWVFVCVKQVNMGSLQISGGDFEMFLTSSPNAPGATAEARHRKAVLAIHDEAEPLSFYHPLTH